MSIDDQTLADVEAENRRLRTEVELLRAEIESFPNCRSCGWKGGTHELGCGAPEGIEVSRLRTALERIAQANVDWTKGPAFNVNILQAIAEAALTPTTGGTPATCASWCGARWRDVAIKDRPGAGHFYGWNEEQKPIYYCTPACRDAARPLNPAPDLSPEKGTGVDITEHGRRMLFHCPSCGAPAGYGCSNGDPLANHCPERGRPSPEASK